MPSVENPEPAVEREPKSNIQFYSLMFVVIDGHLQAEEQSVDVRLGGDRKRVYVRWAVPVSGFEWDGRPYVGTDRTVQIAVLGPGAEYVINGQARCVWFAASHGVNTAVCARAIFEVLP